MSSTAAPDMNPPSEVISPWDRRRAIGLLSLAHAANDTYVYVLQALLPVIIPSLGLTLGMAGGLVSIYLLTSSLLQPMIGILADRSAARWPVWVGMSACAVGAGLIGVAPNYWSLVGVLVLSGLGTALFHPVAAAMVSGFAPDRARGTFYALYVSAGSVGTVFGPIAIGPLVARFGAAGSWAIMLPALLLAIPTAIFAPPARAASHGRQALRTMLHGHERELSALVGVAALRQLSSTATVTFIPLLAVLRGGSLEFANWALSAFLIGNVVGGVAAGPVVDRAGLDRTLKMSLLVSVPIGAVLALTDTGWLFVAAAGLSGVFLFGSFIILTLRGQEMIPNSVGMMTGVVLGLSAGLGGLAVTPIALLAEHAGLPIAAVLAAGTAGLAAVAARFIPPAQVDRHELLDWRGGTG